ncbi:hypothetical protein J3458_016466 [Metarhizium acridum]|uniref:uncharacterized protein n=1 Tax=Metarhizium acridum TaxID=92637 RepID=UPI001C6D06B9|nr:hypothetical protein J3458_016466 [Metarhizium acridum]
MIFPSSSLLSPLPLNYLMVGRGTSSSLHRGVTISSKIDLGFWRHVNNNRELLAEWGSLTLDEA